MFPHDKLDWTLKRLEQRLDAAADDVAGRAEYARACLSKAMFHGGGEIWFNRALTQARRVLQHDPSNVPGLVVAGMALVGLDRLEPAARYLDEALRLEPERATVHLAMGFMLWREGSRHQAVRELESTARLAPDSWEAHYMLGRLLGERADELGNPRRLQERSQFHIVRALQLGPSAALRPDLLHDLGISCLRTGRLPDALKLFTELLEHDRYATRARYYTGLVNFQMGKYKNAILHLRRHLEEKPDAQHVHARIAMAYLHLGEVHKAREACHRALAIEPTDLQARWTLGCAWLEDGQTDEAARLFKDILRDAPDHLPAFTEMVRIRRTSGWLRQALSSEVGVYDQLPTRIEREHPSGRGIVEIDPRRATRERIGIILQNLSQVEPPPATSGPRDGQAPPSAPRDGAVSVILEAMNQANDEGLRFALWEAALNQLAANRARDAALALKQPGRVFSAKAGREVLTLAGVIPEPLLVKGLDLSEEDLKRAAVDRYPRTRDVDAHRDHIEEQREHARAWQAMLLLAIATRQTRTGKTLLVRWASQADPELQAAANAALALLGDPDAGDRLRMRARGAGVQHLVDELVAAVGPKEAIFHPRPVSDDEALHCSTCGRGAADAMHLLAGGEAVICNHCVASLALDRREHTADDPAIGCSLCGNNSLDGRAVYLYRGVPVCGPCIDNSLGLQEREEVDRYLATAL